MSRAAFTFATTLTIALAGCSPSSGTKSGTDTPIRITVADRAESEAQMPGKIDPRDARWRTNATVTQARYGEEGKAALLTVACDAGDLTFTRNFPSDTGAKAMLAFVGYRGIMRLKVENDGKVWRGTVPANDKRLIALTGGPFYATVAGGGKVISPVMGSAGSVITGCKAKPAASAEHPAET